MNKSAIVLWFLGGAGVYLLYCAVKNVNPASQITSYFTGDDPVPLSKLTSATQGTSAVVNVASDTGQGTIVNGDGSLSTLPPLYTDKTYVGTVDA